LFAAEKNGNKKSAMGKKIVFESSFSPRTNIFFEFFLLVSNVKLCKKYDKKKKKVQKSFSHGKKDGEMLIGYIFCIGYTYRANCMFLQSRKMYTQVFSLFNPMPANGWCSIYVFTLN
jgi:hypothetical protein